MKELAQTVSLFHSKKAGDEIVVDAQCSFLALWKMELLYVASKCGFLQR